MSTNYYGFDKKQLEDLSSPNTLRTEEELIKLFKVLPSKEDLEKQSCTEYYGNEKTDDMNHETGILYDQNNRVTYIIQGISQLNQQDFIKQSFIPYKTRYGITLKFRDEIEDTIRTMDEINQNIINYEGKILGLIELIERFYSIIYGESFKRQIDIQNKIQTAKEKAIEKGNKDFRYIK